jgi:hypothetical protein
MAVICGIPAAAVAIDPGVIVVKPATQPPAEPPETAPILQPYEPLTGGYTHDSNDTGFLDVNLSLKILLLPWSWTSSWHVHPYFAMATRFGFYWGSRPNSPVIGKSYNPLLLIRYLPHNKDGRWSPDGHSFERAQYIDFIPYAHQSNGQLIHTQADYDAELKSLGIASYTNNFIHRGWDYTGIVWKKSYAWDMATYLEGRYFIPDGYLQGPADEYQSWEHNPQGKPRKAVDGLSAMVEYPASSAHFVVDLPDCPDQPNTLARLVCTIRPNLTVKYLTGYDTPFKYSTERVELGFQVFSLPLAVWIQHGYMSSLAMYYEKVNSSGIEVRFETF